MYTKDELEIVDYIEESNPASVPDAASKIDRIKSAVSDKYTKRKAIIFLYTTSAKNASSNPTPTLKPCFFA